MCNEAGQCLCGPEFTGPRCDECRSSFHSYPDCHGETRTDLTRKSFLHVLTLTLSNITQCAPVTPVRLWTPAVASRVSVTANPITTVPDVTSAHQDTTDIPAARVSWVTGLCGRWGCVVFAFDLKWLCFSACDCSAEGSGFSPCDAVSGQCVCHPNVAGQKCDRCSPGSYDFPLCRGDLLKLIIEYVLFHLEYM